MSYRVKRSPNHSYCRSIHLRKLLKEKAIGLHSPAYRPRFPSIGVRAHNNEPQHRPKVAFFQLEPLTTEKEDNALKNPNKSSKKFRKIKRKGESRMIFYDRANTISSCSNEKHAKNDISDIYDISRLPNQYSDNEANEADSPDCIFGPKYI